MRRELEMRLVRRSSNQKRFHLEPTARLPNPNFPAFVFSFSIFHSCGRGCTFRPTGWMLQRALKCHFCGRLNLPISSALQKSTHTSFALLMAPEHPNSLKASASEGLPSADRCLEFPPRENVVGGVP